jgi:hypothetical protein
VTVVGAACDEPIPKPVSQTQHMLMPVALVELQGIDNTFVQ